MTSPSAVFRQTFLRCWPAVAVFVFITLPWLNPFSPGPTPAVMPWLVSLASLAFVLLWAARVHLARVAAAAWLTAALLSAVMGLLQYFGAAALLSPWVDNTGIGEAFANLRQRNQFATLTNIGLAALWWWVVQGQSPATQAEVASLKPFSWRSLAALAAAAVLAFGNAASSSRTGLVQLVLLMAMAWGWHRSAPGENQSIRLRLLLVAALAYGIAALALPVLVGLNLATNGIVARLHDEGSLCSSRLILWRNVLHLIALKPWFGWGWGELNFAHFITFYPDLRFCEILDNAHNLPLHLAVELGLPVAVLACASTLWLTLRARPWRESDSTRQLAWLVLAVIMLHSLLEYPLWYGPFQMAFGLCLWLLWRPRERLPDAVCGPLGAYLGASKVSPKIGSSSRTTTYWRLGVALGLITYAAYAAWDYQRVSQIYLTPDQRSPAYREATLEKIGSSRLFQNQLDFAELTTTPLTRANAVHQNALAKKLLHFSPEPRVIEQLIESAALLGRTDEVRFYQLRYRAAFLESYTRWLESSNWPAPNSFKSETHSQAAQ
jgi:O-antigen ligase